MHPWLYHKEVKCIYCSEEFDAIKYRTKVNIKSRDEDFCVHFNDPTIHPYLYDVYICPHCFMLLTERTLNKYLKPVEKKNIKENYTTKIDKMDKLIEERSLSDGVRIYKLLYYLNTLTNEKQIIQAGTALKIAWLFRFLKEESDTALSNELKYLKIAYNHFLYAYENERTAEYGYEGYKVAYLLAIIAKQLNLNKEARVWFGRLLENRDMPISFKRKAQDIWLDFKHTNTILEAL